MSSTISATSHPLTPEYPVPVYIRALAAVLCMEAFLLTLLLNLLSSFFSFSFVIAFFGRGDGYLTTPVIKSFFVLRARVMSDFVGATGTVFSGIGSS